MSKKGISMIDPPLIELLGKIDNRYSLIVAAAKRARQLIDGEEPTIDVNSTKPVTVAIKEINKEAVTIEEEN
ncbi:DNA-directed RNA polymerase subunit omega [Haloimpatiens sp. FM7330]|uniref:DNA-directed RNA polymerase subunit omega n=1 Tax=Haloimpatiens sp. FM7330 TaxID=3298610 RepID=UPI00362A558A